MSKSLNKPILIMMLGLPGAGKSTFASQLTSKLRISNIREDRLSKEVLGQDIEPTKPNKKLYLLTDYLAEEILRIGGSVIMDVDANRRSRRHQLRMLATKLNRPTLLVWVQTDAPTANKRACSKHNNSNDPYFSSLTGEQFKVASSKLQKPEYEDYLVISGKHTFESQYAVLSRKLSAMGLLGEQVTPPAKPAIKVQAKLGGRVDFTRRNSLR